MLIFRLYNALIGIFLFLFLLLCVLGQTAYVDVCDDTRYAFRAKSLMDRAVAANVPAITTGGIYPGVSNGAYHEHYCNI